MADVSYGSVQFRDKVAFFRRKLNLSTRSWTDIVHEQHDHAFVIAGANRDDLVADFREAVDKAIARGATLEEFRKDFDRIVEKYGWAYNGGRNWRSRVIYETNMRTSYAAGRYAQLQAVKATRPYWLYQHSDAVVHPRPMHLAWNNLVLHADDPWWKTHYPPNGWGCQCYVQSLNQRGLERMGKTGPDTAPPDDVQMVTIGKNGPSPRVVATPAGVDPGWGYAPGADAYERQLAQRALEATTRLPAAEAAQSADATLALESAQRALAQGYEQWLGDLAHFAGADASYLAGALDRELVAELYAKGLSPSTAAIRVRQAVVASVQPDIASALTQLPAALRAPKAVLLDTSTQSLLFLQLASRGGNYVGYNVALGNADGVANSVTSAGLLDQNEIRRRVSGGQLVLVRGSL